MNYSELNCNFVCLFVQELGHIHVHERFLSIILLPFNLEKKKLSIEEKKQFLYSQRVSIYIWIILIFRNHYIKSTTDAIFNEIIIISLSVSFFNYLLLLVLNCFASTFVPIYMY